MSAAGQISCRTPAIVPSKGGGVAEYKLYCLDQRGRIARRHDFEAADDRAAAELGRTLAGDSDCELWCGTRKVATLRSDDWVWSDRG
jgi:hypothetical protein